MTTATHCMPNLTKLLIRYIRQDHPDFFFSSIVINVNVESAPHVDKNNLGLSKVIAFGKHRGGKLWVHDDDGAQAFTLPHFPKHYLYKAGQTYNGRLLDICKKWQDLDGNRLHYTQPFTGTRISIIYYTVDRYKETGPKVQ